MIGHTISFVLRNLPGFLFVIAILAPLRRGAWSAERFLAWILVLPLGIGGLWGAFFHLTFPTMSAAYIGWAPSPFQFEVGIANLAIGITCCLAFRSSLPFKAAAVCASGTWLFGDAIGHVQQMIQSGNFAPGNAGLPFISDIVLPVLSIILLAVAWRRR